MHQLSELISLRNVSTLGLLKGKRNLFLKSSRLLIHNYQTNSFRPFVHSHISRIPSPLFTFPATLRSHFWDLSSNYSDISLFPWAV